MMGSFHNRILRLFTPTFTWGRGTVGARSHVEKMATAANNR